MADPIVKNASQVLPGVTVNGTVKPGDPVYHDGTGWVRADADSNATYAEMVSLGHGDTTYRTTVAVAKRGMIEDADAPFTRADNQYLSGTPGAPTSTKPSGDDDVVQKIGEAVSTSIIIFDIPFPHFVQVPMIQKVTTSGETNVILDSGAIAGDQLDAGSEDTYQNFVIPLGFIAWGQTQAWAAVETDVNFDYTVSVTSAASGEAHDVETSSPDQGATANAVDQTPDTVGALDIASSLDLAGISEPGKLMGVQFNRDTSGTDVAIFLGIELEAEAV